MLHNVNATISNVFLYNFYFRSVKCEETNRASLLFWRKKKKICESKCQIHNSGSTHNEDLVLRSRQ